MHEVSIEDVKAYLATLAPEQSCGIPGRPRACLVEKTLEHKYPGQSFHVNSYYARPLRGKDDTYPADSADFDFSDDVQYIVRAFDRLAIEENPRNTFVTRLEVEQAIPELKEN